MRQSPEGFFEIAEKLTGELYQSAQIGLDLNRTGICADSAVIRQIVPHPQNRYNEGRCQR